MIMKWVLFIFMSFSVFAAPCDQDEVLDYNFIRIPIGSWSVDALDAQKVFDYVDTYILANPKAKVSKVNIHSCVLKNSLKSSNLTLSKQDLEQKHSDIAKDRMQPVLNAAKTKKYKIISGHSVCGTSYVAADKNLRFKVKIPGEAQTKKIYNEAIASVLSTDGIMEEFKRLELAQNRREAKQLSDNPFEVKYTFFNGYVVHIFGAKDCTDKTPKTKKPKPASSKNQ